MQITDRRKDVIKSGGEWISSIDLENAAMAASRCRRGRGDRDPAPEMGGAAAAGRHAARRTACPSATACIALLAQRFPRWMLPDDVVVLDELPHTATGKIMKTQLREMFADHVVGRISEASSADRPQ